MPKILHKECKFLGTSAMISQDLRTEVTFP